MAGTSAEVEAAEQQLQQTSPAGTRSSAPRSKSKRSPKGGVGGGSTVISSSSKRRGSKGGSSGSGKKRGEDRPSTPSMRVYDEAGCSSAAVVASRPTRPMTSTLTDKFAELDEDEEEEYSDGDDDDEGEKRQQRGQRQQGEQTTIQVRPLPKIRLDLMPSPREEDEYRRASPRSGGSKKKKSGGSGGGSGSGSGGGSGKRRSSGRSSRRSSGAASDDGADGDVVGVGNGNATRNAAGGTPVLNESMTSSTGAVMDHATTVGQKVGRVKAAARALEEVAAAAEGRRGTVSAGAVSTSTDRDGAVAKAGARNTNVGGAAAAGGGGGGEEGDELDADGFPLRPTRLFHDNTSTGTTGCGDDVVMDGFGNAFYDDSNDDGAGARPSDDGAQFPSSPSPLLAIQQNSGGGDSARGGLRGRGGHHHRLVSDVAVASAESASASASSNRSPTAPKDSRKDAHDVSPGYVQVTKTKIERDEFAALSDEQCDDEEDEDEDEDADTTPVAAPDADSTDKVFRSIKEYAREKADAVSIEDDDDDDDDDDDHDENDRGVSPKRSPRGKVPERSPTKSSRRTEKDDYASPPSPEHRQDDRRRRSGKARREKEERTAHTDSSFSPFDWLLMICGDVSSIVSEGMGGHDDEDRTHDGTSTTAADEYHEDEQGGSTRSRKEYGIDKFSGSG
eukprot:CAMPEP_0178622782 /NCGR_PEP_ID=MMETSP0698-20121128/6504_1 /TAXON_ID=265572 /ORGANISM="Extubocellulus spinifer, Strain CCMP396" /LENGTH=674 /DNA_ID=CAMNT_0020261853 /DNA_START=128 /DNA_END=2149 /DNA_ORIENTATION=-